MQQVAARLPWFPSRTLLDRMKQKAARERYVGHAIEHGWSRSSAPTGTDTGDDGATPDYSRDHAPPTP